LRKLTKLEVLLSRISPRRKEVNEFRQDLAKTEESINFYIEKIEREHRQHVAEMEARHASDRATEQRLKERIAELEAERKRSLGKGFAAYAFAERTVINQAEEEEQQRKDFAKMLARITHDFKTPIMIIRTAMLMIKEGLKEGSDKKMSDMVLQGADSLSALVEDVLTCNKLEHGAITLEKKRYDIAEQLRYLVNGSRKYASDKGKEIEFNTEPGVFVNADAFRMEQALGNLLSNAIKFSKNKVTVSVKKEGDSAVVTVSDDGNGIEEEMRSKVFKGQEMMTVDLINGNGFGLTNAKRLVDMHGGSIRLVGGSTFVVTLPAEQ